MFMLMLSSPLITPLTRDSGTGEEGIVRVGEEEGIVNVRKREKD